MHDNGDGTYADAVYLVGLGTTSPTITHHHVAFTASQTAQVVWTPAAGNVFVITHITVSAGATGAGTLTIYDNTNSAANIIAVLQLANNGGWDADFVSANIMGAAANNVLYYTSGSGAAGDITVHGYEVV